MNKVALMIACGAWAALAGCGGPAEQPDDAAPTAGASAAQSPPAAATPTTPADGASAVPTATMTPGATAAATPTATATATAAVPGKAPAAATPAAPAALVPASAPAARPPAYMVCAACHQVQPGRNGVGPSLHGVVGRQAASVPGFNYSPALKAFGKAWTRDEIDAYITKPTAHVPGTKMIFPGVPDAARRKVIIDYLATLK
jgi:cytochrome c